MTGKHTVFSRALNFKQTATHSRYTNLKGKKSVAFRDEVLQYLYGKKKNSNEFENQEPVTRSLYTKCTLELTLSRIFLVSEL